ncbi:MAG: DUF6157 family protein [Rhodobacteraceae bacterium]|nr:DUF6157 family protein [Paracoccaceae bacterium]
MHSTNYLDTLICPAEDCLSVAAVPVKAGSIALLQYELLAANPYGMTSDDVLSKVAAQRQGIDDKDFASFRTQYFSKGQPCFRASPLTKTHGWAVHSNSDGCVALLSPKGPEFADLWHNDKVKKLTAMRSKRA